ncbi:uncharacterized protein LOC144109471 isoform X2 [Amblyomma americanum]
MHVFTMFVPLYLVHMLVDKIFFFLEQGGQYIVVKFPEEDDSVAIVPKRWIRNDMCRWPPEMRHVDSLLKAGATPGPDWKELPCMVVQAFDTYAEARLRLRRAEDTSDLQSDYDLGRGKRKRNTKRFQESENDDEEYRHPPSPPLSMFKKARDKRMQRSKTQRLHSLQSSQQSGHNGESDAEMQRIHSPRCSGMQVPSSWYAAASSTGVQQRPEQTGGWRAPWSESHSNRWAQADTMHSPPTNSSVPDGRFRSAPSAGSDERSYASSPGSSVANTSRHSGKCN